EREDLRRAQQHHLPALPEPLRHQRAAHRRAPARDPRATRRGLAPGSAIRHAAPRDPPRGAHLPRPARGAALVAGGHRAPRLPQHAGQDARLIATAVLVLPNFVLILAGLVLSRRFSYARTFWEG